MKCSVFFSVLDPFSAISVWICWVPSALSLNLSLFCSCSAKCESQCFFFFLGVNLNLTVFALSLLSLNITVLGSFSGESDFQHCVFLCTEFGTYLMSQSASTLGLVPIHHRRDWKEMRLTEWAVVQEPQLKASYCGSLHCYTTSCPSNWLHASKSTLSFSCSSGYDVFLLSRVFYLFSVLKL